MGFLFTDFNTIFQQIIQTMYSKHLPTIVRNMRKKLHNKDGMTQKTLVV